MKCHDWWKSTKKKLYSKTRDDWNNGWIYVEICNAFNPTHRVNESSAEIQAGTYKHLWQKQHKIQMTWGWDDKESISLSVENKGEKENISKRHIKKIKKTF